MPIDSAKVALAVSSGVSIVCATCEKYWQGRDAGLPGDRCTAKTPCGSPIAGDVFHEYVGPITQFDRWCFACGSPATHALRVKSLVRVIGCCSSHLDLVRTLKPENRDAVVVSVLSKDGENSSDRLIAPRQLLKFRSQ